MNKGERDELRRLIKARFKVLTAEVHQRAAELTAELHVRIQRQFAHEDKLWNDTSILVEEAVREANRKVNDIYRGLYGDDEWGVSTDKQVIVARAVGRPPSRRQTLRAQGEADIEARVKSALLELQRRQVDLETELTTTALESADAQRFVHQIPTVSELVPESRLLAAIENITGDDDLR